MFREVSARPDFLAMEAATLRLWQVTQAFERLREQTAGGEPWSFLDGPITANNPMGVHHAWGRTYKDVFNRYRAMRGHALRWQQGFDCQGLWVEVEVEKQLGFTSKRDIEAYGVDRFVEACKQRVFHFAGVQAAQSQRLGYWMDWDNSYYTFSDDNNYAIWHFLKRCHTRGLLYRGADVMPWCPRCATALSEMELAEGYKDVTDTALYVRLPLVDRPGEALLVWTTTPWTLPAHVAAAVHPELVYVRAHGPEDAGRLWVGQEAAQRLGLRVDAELPGRALVGWRYSGPFDELPAQAGVAHRVVAWDQVSAAEGTGLVHVAPGCGPEDFRLGQVERLAALAPLDEQGVFLESYGWLAGQRAHDVAPAVAASLAGRRLLWQQERYLHRYPHCWRCGTALLYRLVDEWFLRMEPLRAALEASARQATWLPASGLDRELDWLRNMGDWMISKKRYWGLALPIYPCSRCGTVTVVGSKAELRDRAVAGWEQFEGHSPHRPWVDAVQVACDGCGAPVQRVADVGNPWLDAGIVPFSTLQYGADPAYWRRWFPADLVVESFPGQFRNWFYALLAMSTVLEGCAPFKTLLGYATVRDAHGQEMHKSKGNAVWFEEAASWAGVEPLRWLFAGQPVERNLHLGRALVDGAARRLQPLWEVYRFFVTYARASGWAGGNAGPGGWATHPGTPVHMLDRWLIARLARLTAAGTAALDGYDARTFTVAVEAFVDDLSNWYVRRSRRRFWGRSDGGGADPQAMAVLYHTLVTLARLLAPVLPFLAEELYQNLVRSVDGEAPVSVHLTGYPVMAELDDTLVAEVAAVRRVVALGHSLRKQARLRVRQPLARVLVAGGDAALRAALTRFQDDLLAELNVKALEFREVPAGERLVAAAEDGLVVALDVALTPELEREGRARDLVRAVQEARRRAGLAVSDRIVLTLPGEAGDLLDEWGAYVAEETLAVELRPGSELAVQRA